MAAGSEFSGPLPIISGPRVEIPAVDADSPAEECAGLPREVAVGLEAGQLHGLGKEPLGLVDPGGRLVAVRERCVLDHGGQVTVTLDRPRETT